MQGKLFCGMPVPRKELLIRPKSMNTLLAEKLSSTALAFRGYNTTNLGRTAELLSVPAYAPLLLHQLGVASKVCGDVLGRPVDLLERVKSNLEAELERYAEAVALVFAVELAQLDMLREVHGIDPQDASLAFGYSLGELVALAASGRLVPEESMRVPLAMATDCAALSPNATMGILFSRSLPIDEQLALQLCDEISAAGKGVIGISAILSPNTFLILGQNETVERFKERMVSAFPHKVHLRVNDSRWPPLHTPIVRQRNVPDRAAVMLQTMQMHNAAARLPVFSLVTGQLVTDGVSTRQTLRDWIDQPQRLWDAVCYVLQSAVDTVVHVGPAPNVIPATFARLSENVQQVKAKQNLSGLRARAMARLVDRRWLSSRLPTSASLLRAPQLEHIILEDWLLENAQQ